MGKLFIFAGTINEAYKFARSVGLRPDQVQYVYDVEALMGAVDPIMVTIGTAYTRHDYKTVMERYATTQRKVVERS